MHKTKKIYLSPLSLDDSEILFDWINERDLIKFNSNYKPTHKPNHQVWFDSIIKRQDVFIFGIRRVKDRQLIGSCRLNSINFVYRNAELQIRIAAESERGRGFGSDAVQLLLRFAFDDLNLNKVFLNVFSTNIGAIKVYEKSGFRQEGELEQHVFIDGCYLNVIIMAILRKEYEKLYHHNDSSA